MRAEAACAANRTATAGQSCAQSSIPPCAHAKNVALVAALIHVAEQQQKPGILRAAATRKQQLSCSGLRYDHTPYGGMPFGHGAGDCISKSFDATPTTLWSRA